MVLVSFVLFIYGVNLFSQYVPYVGDSKRAMDEYTSEIFMGGKSTIVLHNTCEDSLLAAPIILDLVLLAELSTRIQLKAEGEVCFLYSIFKTLAFPWTFLVSLNGDTYKLLFHLYVYRASFTLSTLWLPFSVTSPRLLL